jgi:Ca2+-binding RTX toxin-like protein
MSLFGSRRGRSLFRGSKSARRTTRTRRRDLELFVEQCERRTLLSTLDVDAVTGALTFTSVGAVDNDLTVSSTGPAGDYTFADPNETITLGPGALGLGWTGDGTNSVSGPSADVTSIALDMGAGADTLTIQSVDASTTMTNAAGGSIDFNISGAGIPSGVTVDLAPVSVVLFDAFAIDAGGLTGEFNIAPDLSTQTYQATGQGLVTLTASPFAVVPQVSNSAPGGLTFGLATLPSTSTGDISISLRGPNGDGGLTWSLGQGPTSVTEFGNQFPVDELAAINVGDGGGGFNETLTLDFSLGNFLPAGGVTFTAGAGQTNLLELQGGSFTDEVYNATGPGAGDISFDGGPAITFSNLSPIEDIVPVTNFTFNAPAGAGSIVLTDGPDIGVQTGQINDDGTGAFELINFANKQNVSLVADATTATTFTVENTLVVAGLESLTLVGGDEADDFVIDLGSSLVGPDIDIQAGLGDDALFLTGNLPAAAATYSTGLPSLTGNTGTILYDNGVDDRLITFDGLAPVFDTTVAASLTVDDLALIAIQTLVNVNIDGTDYYQVNFGLLGDAAEAYNFLNKTDFNLNGTALVDVTTINVTTNLGDGLTTINVNTLDLADVIQVLATPAGVTTNIDSGFGLLDSVFIGATAIDYALGLGTLDDIQGPVQLDDTDLFSFVGISDIESTTNNTYVITATSVQRFGTALIGLTAGEVDSLEVLGGQTDGVGINSYLVNGTGANLSTLVRDGGGDSDFFIQGDSLTADNRFEGGDGNDSFDLFAGVGIAANSVVIDGQDGIDQVRAFGINSGFINITFRYLSTAGDADVEGLGTTVNLLDIQDADIIGQGPFTNLAFIDDTDGVHVIDVAPLTFDSGRIRVDGGPPTAAPFIAFSQINSFSIDGDGDGSGDRDTLRVFTPSTTGLGTGFEAVYPDGRDELDVTDSQVFTNNAFAGPLITVNLVTSSFTDLDVMAGNEFPEVGDTIRATGSTSLEIFIDGQEPLFPSSPGDTLILFFPEGVDIFRDPITNNYQLQGTGGSAPVDFSGIETIVVEVGNGVVNVLGDRGGPVPEEDLFEVRGSGPDAGLDPGPNRLTVRINDPLHLEAAVRFVGVSFLNVLGFELKDELRISAYSDNTPEGWGVAVLFDEGPPLGDLLVYDAIPGVSENMTVAPSSPENGQFTVVQANTGTPVVTINYLNNIEIVVNANDGLAGDTDTLFLQGGPPSLVFGSGATDWDIDFDAAGTGAEPIVAAAVPGFGPYYQINSVTNLDAITFVSGDGANRFGLRAWSVSPLQPIFVGGAGDDELNIDTDDRILASKSIDFDGRGGFDSLSVVGTPLNAVETATYTPIAPRGGTLEYATGGEPLLTIHFQDLEPVLSLVPAAALVVNGTGADNAITYVDSPVPGWGLVTIDSFEAITFANKATLVLNGNGGNDAFSINAAGVPDGLTAITVSGGNPTDADSLSLSGTAGADDVVFTPTGAGGGSITVGAQPTVTFDTISRLNYNGQGGDDTITVNGEGNIAITPGSTRDSGSARVDSTIALGFENLGFGGAINVPGGAGAELLVIEGTPGDDEFLYSALSQQILLVNGVGTHVAVNRGPDVDGVRILGLGGNNVASLAGDGTQASVTFGNPTTFLNGAGLTFTEILGIADLRLFNDTGNIAVLGTLLPDAIDVTPQSVNTARITIAGLLPVLTATTNAPGGLAISDLSIGDGDTLTIHGTAGDDSIVITRGPTTTVQVGALKPIDVDSAAIEALTVASGLGNDTFNVSGSGGPALSVAGGGQSDRLGVSVSSGLTLVAPGVTDDAGLVDGPGADDVSFAGIRFLDLTGTGAAGDELVVQGTNGEDNIVVANRGVDQVWVNNRAVTSFTGFPTLSVRARMGADTITVEPVGLVSATVVNVAGNALGEGDRLNVLGSSAGEAISYSPAAGGSGSVQVGAGAVVDFTTTEFLFIDGRGGGDTLTVNGTGSDDLIAYTPGTTRDSGAVRVNELVPLSFVNLGTDGSVNFVGGGLVDRLAITGTAGNDVFDVAGVTGTIQQTSAGVGAHVPVTQAGITELVLEGLAGDDTFNIAGDHPYGLVLVEGGDPSASDVLNFLGTGGPIIAGFDTFEIVEIGFGPVSFSGIEDLRVDGAGATTTVVGTAANDAIRAEATGVGSNTRVRVNDLLPVVNILNGGLTVDGGAGTNSLFVPGTEAPDTIAVDPTTVTVNGTAIGYANIAALAVDALGGNDTITSTGALPAATSLLAGSGNDTIDSTGTTAGVTQVGGDGDDTLTGGDGDDLQDGGAGNDDLRGGAGADTQLGGDGDDVGLGGPGVDQFFGGADSDRFTWNPGDGDDLFEGGTGEDVLVFNGSGGNEVFTFTAIGTRVLFQRDLGGIDIDTADVEQFDLFALGGADTATVNDLFGTAARVINIDLGIDAVADSVTVNGRNLPEDLAVSAAAGTIGVSGLTYDVRVFGSDGPSDVLTVRGNDGNDTIKAANGVEALIGIVLEGNDGDDFLSADATLLGGAGNDTLVGGAGNDSLDGGDGDDQLFGLAGDDTLLGGAGDDILDGGTGTNVLDGGTGFNRITVAGTAGPDTISAIGPNAALVITVNGISGTNDVTNIERLDITTGDGNDDIRLETALPSLVVLGAGDDVADATGSTGSATIVGGWGDDAITGGSAGDRLIGDFGNDTITGGPGNDSIFGGDGSDRFLWAVGDGDDIVEGGLGDNELVMNGDPTLPNNFVLGRDGIRFLGTLTFGSPPLLGGSVSAAEVEHVSVLGGSGADRIVVRDLSLTDVRLVSTQLNPGLSPDDAEDCVIVNGSNANDSATISLDDEGVVQVEGLHAQVEIRNSNLLDWLDFKANAGNDEVAVVPPVLTRINVILEGGFGNDTLSGARFQVGGPGDDVLIGTDEADTLLGGAGNDSLVGLAGNDVLLGDADGNGECGTEFAITQITSGFGNDTVQGGAGDDTINGEGGDDLLNGDAGNDLIGIVTVGSRGPTPVILSFNEDGNDTINGGDGSDTALAGAGNDVVNGDADNDYLDGGDGDDAASGGTGNDTVLGRAGNDQLFGDDGNDSVFGGAGNDTASGSAGDDTLCGEDGDDVLSGDDGADILLGGAGNDAASGGAGSDTVFGGVGNDTLSGDDGDDFLFGNDGDDLIFGNDGNDVAYGQNGNDTIYGGLGNDSLYGNDGDDLIHGGNGPFRPIHTPPPPGPDDGNDLIAGGNGFDIIDGGSGNNFLDAGNDNIRETVLGGRGNDVGWRHDNNGRNRDAMALDGGHNRVIGIGALEIPNSPDEPPCDSANITPANVGSITPINGPALTAGTQVPPPVPSPSGHTTRNRRVTNPRARTRPPVSTATKPRPAAKLWRANALKRAAQKGINLHQDGAINAALKKSK